MLCSKCNENEAGHANWTADGGLCDYCAEEYGCECGCFPPPSLASFCEANDMVPVRVTRTVLRQGQHIQPAETVIDYYHKYEEVYITKDFPEVVHNFWYTTEVDRWESSGVGEEDGKTIY